MVQLSSLYKIQGEVPKVKMVRDKIEKLEGEYMSAQDQAAEFLEQQLQRRSFVVRPLVTGRRQQRAYQVDPTPSSEDDQR